MKPKNIPQFPRIRSWLGNSLALLLLGIFSLSISSCDPSDTTGGGKEDPNPPADTVGLKDNGQKFKDPIPNTDLGKQLKAHINVMTGHGEAAEKRYQSSLAKMKESPGMAKTVLESYKGAEEMDYQLRTLLALTLKNLENAESLNAMLEIARSQIPRDKYPKSQEVTTVQNEVVIRSFAVEGIGLLAANGDEKADKALEGLIDLEDITLRQLAVRGYLNAKGANARRRVSMLRDKLPKDQHWMIQADLTDIKTVPHPEMPKEFDLDKFKNTGDDPAPKLKQ